MFLIVVASLLALGAGVVLKPANMITVGHKWREKLETILVTTVQTIDFSTLMPEHGVMAWTFVITGANNSIGGSAPTEYLGKLGTGNYFDTNAVELVALLEFLYSRYGGAIPATTDLTYPIPFHLLNILIPDLTANGVFPEVGLPAGTQKIWQLFLGATSTAGSATIGWLRSMRQPTHIPYIVGHAVTGLSASVNSQPYKLPWQPLPTAGFLMPTGATEFTRIKLMVPDENGIAVEQFDMTLAQILCLSQPYIATQAPNPIVVAFGKTITIRNGSYMLIDAGAGVNGTQRFVPLQFIDVNAGIPGLPQAPKAA